MDALGEIMVGKSFEDVRLPDLDWMKLPKDNIPTENLVEAIPQLEEQWKEEKKSPFLLIPGLKSVEEVGNPNKIKDNSKDIVDYVKKLMMRGILGKELVNKISETFFIEDIEKAKDLLEDLAKEQGLLGKVYLDLSSFEDCEDALRYLGKDRVKQVLFVIGSPKRCCSNHNQGYCNVLNKDVRKDLIYTDKDFDYYDKKLRMLGIIEKDEGIKSKEDLQKAMLKVKKPERNEIKEKESYSKYTEKEMKDALKEQIEKASKEEEKKREKEKFLKIRPILAGIQNLMLKGKYGDDLKELIKSKYTDKDLEDCKEELKKIISLQGLLGNVYVDISFYSTPEEAIEAIKSSETSPLFVVQSFKNNMYDNSLEKVCKATGCIELPLDGKIDLDVIVSYLQDLLVGKKIDKSQYDSLVKKAEDDNSILIIKEAFDLAAINKKETVIGGVPGFFVSSSSTNEKRINEEEIESKIDEAIKKGISVGKIVNKVATLVGSEDKANSLVRKVVSNKKLVYANVLSNCDKENYKFVDSSTVIVPSDKCVSCVFNSNFGCIKQQVKFAGKSELKYFDFEDLDEKIKKVQIKENPDVEREDMKQKYDMSDSFGSGMNKALDRLRK